MIRSKITLLLIVVFISASIILPLQVEGDFHNYFWGGGNVKIACWREQAFCKEGAERWGEATGGEASLVSLPSASAETLNFYRQILAAGASDIDAFLIDAKWMGSLANHFSDLSEYSKGAKEYHFESIIENNTIGDRLIAMPWSVEIGLLYYRKDLLEKYGESVPTTWEQLAATAKKIQDAERANGNAKMWGFVWQGRAYEGLTANALEWIIVCFR